MSCPALYPDPPVLPYPSLPSLALKMCCLALPRSVLPCFALLHCHLPFLCRAVCPALNCHIVLRIPQGAHVARFLQHNTAMHRMDLAVNQLGDDAVGLGQMWSALRSNTKSGLMYLDVSGNGIRTMDFKAVEVRLPLRVPRDRPCNRTVGQFSPGVDQGRRRRPGTLLLLEGPFQPNPTQQPPLQFGVRPPRPIALRLFGASCASGTQRGGVCPTRALCPLCTGPLSPDPVPIEFFQMARKRKACPKHAPAKHGHEPKRPVVSENQWVSLSLLRPFGSLHPKKTQPNSTAKPGGHGHCGIVVALDSSGR